MKYTLEQLNKIVEDSDGGSLWLNGLTSIPEGFNPTVGGSLWLNGLTSIPEGFNPTVGGNLWLDGLTSIPEGFNPTVGGNLWLDGLTSIPEGFNPTVGGSLWLDGLTRRERSKVKINRFVNGFYKPGEYLFCDGILTHVKKVKRVDKYTLYVGKISGKNVVSDGENYAHCDKLRDGIADLAFKTARDRGASQYKGLSLDTEFSVPEMVTMYRIITGACRQGSENFVNGLGELKEKYTIREAIELTKGQYNAGRFAEFFGCE